MKYLIILFFITISLFLACDSESPTQNNTSLEEKIIGIWAMVKFEYYEMDNENIDQGSQRLTAETTESIFAFSSKSVNAYYVEPGNPTTGVTYTGNANYMITDSKIFFGNYCVGPIEFNGDTLIISEEFTDGYEKGFFIHYSGKVPPSTWPEKTYDVGEDIGI